MIKAFLDTSAALDALRGGDSAELLDPELFARVRYVMNPIVLQEILLAADRSERMAGRLNDILDDAVDFRPLDQTLSDRRHLDRLKRLRNSAVHSNEILVMSSADAAGCDYLITLDRDVLTSAGGESFRAVTPSEFLETIRTAA